MSGIEDHLRALKNAERMLEFDARLCTVLAITGLPRRQVEELFGRGIGRPGRSPSSIDWFHTAKLAERVEASLFAAQYWRNRNNGFQTLESMIDAYQRYLKCIGNDPLISFDRAVNLVCNIEGWIWGVGPRSLDIAVCRRCNAQHLIAVGDSTQAENCVFCKLVARYATDRRLQTRFPPRFLPDMRCPTAATTGQGTQVEAGAGVENPQKLAPFHVDRQPF